LVRALLSLPCSLACCNRSPLALQLLSSNRELLIQIALERNWVPLLLKWLTLYRRPQVQVEALWALTNIAAGTSEHTQVLVRHGAIPILVSLLTSENEEVLEQSVWVLGNLAGEGPATRDTVLAAGVLRPLGNAVLRWIVVLYISQLTGPRMLLLHDQCTASSATGTLCL
jgi:hypothetical protein